MMDLQDFNLRRAVEMDIKEGIDPGDKNLAQLLRDDDLSPAIREYLARRLEGKQKKVGRKLDSSSDLYTKKTRARFFVQEIMDQASKAGSPITEAQAIERLAAQKLPGLSRSTLFDLLK